MQDVERMILGNKCDMEDKRVISFERGQAIAKEHGLRFLETSAKEPVFKHSLLSLALKFCKA